MVILASQHGLRPFSCSNNICSFLQLQVKQPTFLQAVNTSDTHHLSVSCRQLLHWSLDKRFVARPGGASCRTALQPQPCYHTPSSLLRMDMVHHLDVRLLPHTAHRHALQGAHQPVLMGFPVATTHCHHRNSSPHAPHQPAGPRQQLSCKQRCGGKHR